MKQTTTLFYQRPLSNVLLLFGLLLASMGLALLTFSSAQAQCLLLNENFNTNPVLAATNTDGTWYPDRYPPAAFVSDVVSGENALKISISPADGAQNRPSGFSGGFYNTQGRKFNQCGKCVTVAKGDLWIPADWATKHRRSDMWPTAFDVSNAVSFYGIIGFANIDGSSPTLRYWDNAAWVNLANPIAYDAWTSFEVSLVGTDLLYKVNNVTVATIPSSGSIYFGEVIMQAFNFNDNTLNPAFYDPSADNAYDAFWDNLITTGTGGNIVTNVNTGETFCSIQAAIDDANTGNGHTISVAPGTYRENVLVNKSLTILSIGGRGVTFIVPFNTANNATVGFADGINDITFGDIGQGFTVTGFDGGGGIEAGALYLLGSSTRTNTTIVGNELVAAGDEALLGDFNAAFDGVVITDNIISGKTFLGAEPGGCGFSTQFDGGNNVPRGLVVLGGGASVTNSSNVTFVNNTITGTAGGFNTSGGCEQGNTLVTIDVIGATIAQNTFSGTTTRFSSSLRARGQATSVYCNTFDNAGLGVNCTNIFFGSAAPLTGAAFTTLAGVANGNAFINGGAYLTPNNAASFTIYRTFAQAALAATSIGAGQTAVAAATTLNCPVTNLNTGLIYPTIQSGINNVTTLDGHTLEVSAGTYAETIVVDKELTILGPNAAINPCTATPVAEAIIMAPTSQPFYDGSTEVRLMQIEADNVTIKGLTFDGDNPALTNSEGGVIDAADGIDVYVNVGGITIENNIFKNLNEGGVTGYPDGSASFTGNTVSNNKFDNLPGDAGTGYPFSGYGIAVLIYNNFYSDVEDNCMTNVRIGVQTGNYNLADAGNSRTIANNTIGFNAVGIFHNLHYQSASTFDIHDNDLTTANNTTSSGLLIASIQETVGATVTDNNVTGAYAGIEFWNDPTTTTVTATGGTLDGCAYGVFANNYDGYPDPLNLAAATTVAISGVTITNSTIAGVYVKDNPANTNNADITLIVQDDCDIIGTGLLLTGILVEGTDATATVQNNDASISGFAIGVDVDGGSASLFRNSITANATGVRVTNGGNLTATTENFITANTVDGIRVEASAGTIGGIHDNDLSANTGFAINNLAVTTVDATCNWYASTVPATVAAEINGNVTYAPWLTSGTDNAPGTDGFQPVAGCSAPCPTVTCPGNQSVCANASPLALTGEMPTGGIYSGMGINGNNFEPSTAGVGVHTITYTYTDINGCTDFCTFTITVNALPTFGFTATTTNGSSVTGNTNGGLTTLNLNFCLGDFFSFSGYSSVPGSQVGYLEEIPSGTNNVTYNGGAVTVPRAQQDFGPSSVGGLFGGPFGPYDLSSGTSGSLTQTFTPYYDADNSNSYTPGDCLGDPITLIYNINATPLLETSINSAVVTSNNDGTDDTGAFSVCNTPNNILFNSFTDLNGLTPAANVKAYQTFTAMNVTVPFCNNCAATLSAFAGATGTAALVNPALPGTLVVRFRAFFDIDGDNVIDAGECAGDLVVYTVTVNPLPVVTCPANLSVCEGDGQFVLTGESPSGGTYSGTGVTGNGTSFDPDIAGLGNHTITYTYTDGNSCTSTCTFTITVNSTPTVSFDIAGSSVANNNDGVLDVAEAATVEVCDGGTYAVSNLVHSNPASRYQVSVTPSGGVLLFDGSPAGNGDITAAQFDGAVGTHTITLSTPATGGMLVQVITPYNEVDGIPSYTAGDCASDPITITYIAHPIPVLQTTINTVPVTNNNDGVPDLGTVNLCADGLPNNVVINSFVELKGVPAANLRVYQTVALTNATFPYCNACSAALAAFTPGYAATLALSNPALPGSAVVTFQLWDDRNGNTTLDAGECAGDVIQYTFNLYPLPVVTCPANLSVCEGDAPLALTGESPTGGTYSGTGINGNNFEPSTAGVGVHTITYTDGNSCTSSCTFDVTVNARPTFSFDIGSGSAASSNNGVADPAEAVTVEVCNGGTYTLSNLVHSAPTSRYQIAVTASGGILLFNGNPAGNGDITAAQFSGAQATYTITLSTLSTGGMVVQVITPYNDVDGSLSYNAGDCAGDPITVTYIAHPIPVLQTTVNTVQVTANNNGTDDTGSFSVCNSASNNLFFTQFVDMAGVTPSNLVKVQQQFTRTNVTFGPTDGTFALSLFSPAFDRNVSLVNPAVVGTLVMRFRAFFDVNNNDMLDAEDCAGDWIQYTVTVNPLPVVICPANPPSICVTAAPFALIGASPAGGVYSGPGVSSGMFNPAAAGAGTHTITYSYTDVNGCSNTCTFTITVNPLSTFLVCPAPITQTTGANLCTAVVNYTATAGGTPTYTYTFSGATIGSGSGTGSGLVFNKGTTTVVINAVTTCGNPSCTFTVTVNDGQNPSIVCPANQTRSTDPGFCTAVATYTNPIFSDNCAGSSLTRTSGLASGSAFPKGVNMVEWKATDAGGNIAMCQFTITVNDTQLPGITCPANIVKNADAGLCTTVVTFANAIASDNCAGATVLQTAGPASGSAFIKGTTTIEFKASDLATPANTKTCSFTVKVNDNQLPTITCPGNQARSTDAGVCNAVVSYTMPTASDNCALASVAIQSGLISGSAFSKGITIVVWKATDDSGLTKTCSFRVTINDTEAPTMTCPAPISKNTDAGLCTTVVTYTNPTFTDNCPPTGGTSTRYSGLVSGSAFPVGTSSIVFRAIDAAGNTKHCTMTVTVTDAQLPTITCPANIAATGSGSPCQAAVTYASPTVTDNCSGATKFLLSGLASGSVFPVGATINTWRAIASNGQSSTCSFTVTVSCSSASQQTGVSREQEGESSVGSPQLMTLTLAPNPTDGRFNLQLQGFEKQALATIFDATGRQVWQQQLEPEQTQVTVDLSDARFSAGLYLVTVASDGKVLTKRLVLTR